MIQPERFLFPTAEGLYCEPGNFYIDPVKAVDKAIITHGHADHARSGHHSVLATQRTLDIMAIRYGEDFCAQRQAAAFGETTIINDVKVSLHPAGHVLGSAQILLEYEGLRTVVSGDYKRLADPTAETFMAIKCNVFVTEATFGLPVFNHPSPAAEIIRLIDSTKAFPDRTHLVGVYALGKAQRVIRLLRDNGYDEPLFIHGALAKLCDYYNQQGINLTDLHPISENAKARADFGGNIVLGPPSAFNSPWVRRFNDPLIAFASGWMQVRQRIKQRGVELPLVISDHCDWSELTQTIIDVEASKIWVTHGREEALVRWCEINQIRAKPLHLVGYDDEAE